MKREKIAVVGRDREINELLEAELCLNGYSVVVRDTLPSVQSGYDRILLDCDTVVLPVGYEHMTGLVLLTSGQEDLKTAGHVLLKPISLRVLRDLLFSHPDGGEKPTPKEEDAPAFFLDTDGVLHVGERQTLLTAYERILLTRLCRTPGEVVTRDELTSLLGASAGNICDVYICRLRQKLELPDGRRVITTVRGQGYRMERIGTGVIKNA